MMSGVRLLFALALLLVPSSASATTMVRLSVDDLTWIADAVVVAEVEQQQVVSERGYQYTWSALRVDEALKGDIEPGDVLAVRSLGGALGRERTTVPSAAHYTPGERVVTFLELSPAGWRTVGMTQGKYTLVVEPDTGRDVIVRVAAPEGAERFDEALVTLPARRSYADDFLGRLRDDLAVGYVPSFRVFPGMPVDKAHRLLDEARRWGHDIDPRWLRALRIIEQGAGR